MQRLTTLWILLAATPAFAEGGEGGGWSNVIFHAINLALLLFVIVRFAGAKVKVGLEDKASKVTHDIDEAQKLHAAARARLEETTRS